MTYFSLPILLLSMLSVISLATHALDDPSLLYIVCENTTIPKNSPYKSSLSSLLSSFSLYANRNFQLYSLNSSLSSNATSSKIQISVNISNPIYGLHLCRGDVTAEVCQACVAAASKELANKCSREMVAVIWYDECMLRYSNASFFSTVATKPKIGLLNTQNITDQERFNRLLNTTMIDLGSQSSKVTAGAKMFGTKEVNLSQFQTLYNLVQCTQDLSSTDCNTCLLAAIKLLPWCCSGKQGGRIVFPSCNIRYEMYPFYRMVDTAPTPTAELPPLPLPPGSPSGPKGKVDHHFYYCFHSLLVLYTYKK